MAMEERAFSKAELKIFTAKYEVFQAAQKAVDEVVVFLREQHEIPEGEQGWQIGQNGFFRMTPEPEGQIVDVTPEKREKKAQTE